jgi:hypothetical protein
MTLSEIISDDNSNYKMHAPSIKYLFQINLNLLLHSYMFIICSSLFSLFIEYIAPNIRMTNAKRI